MSIDSDVAAAYHEAGHCIVASRLGLRLRSASIEDDGSGGPGLRPRSSCSVVHAMAFPMPVTARTNDVMPKLSHQHVNVIGKAGTGEQHVLTSRSSRQTLKLSPMNC